MRLRNDKEAERVRDAEKRNTKWAGKTDDQKIRSLAKRRGNSTRQVILITGTAQTAKQAARALKAK